MGRREILVFAPLVILTILFGVYPKPVLDMSAASVAQLLENYQAAVAPKKAASWCGDDGGEMSPARCPRCCPRCRKSCSSARWCCSMVGAYREGSVQLVNGCAFVLLRVAALIVVLASRRQARHLRRRLHGRRLRPRDEDPHADRLRRDHRARARLSGGGTAGKVRVRDPDPALDHRHADADLGGRPDRALSRPRTDEPRALRGGGEQSR